MSLGPHTITRQRAPLAEDAFHNQVPDWSTPDELPVPGCSFQPAGATTNTSDGRQVASLAPSVWAPFASDIRDTDRIVFAGTTYEVEGIAAWGFPPLEHLVITLATRKG